MDVQMPQLDGLETTKRIRKEFSIQPIIIALTANPMVEDKERCLDAGMDHYISKPIELVELKNTLMSVAHKSVF